MAHRTDMVRWRQAGRFKQRTFKAKREAERFALRIEDEVEQGNFTDVYVRRSKTVREVVEASMRASAGKLKPRTLVDYEQAYRLHILPVFGAASRQSPARRSSAGSRICRPRDSARRRCAGRLSR